MDLELPMDKVSIVSHTTQDDRKINVVLVAPGSFNPPTFMHLRMLGPIPGEHRLRMCNLACESSDFIMVDPWEANQTYQRTLTILKRIESYFIDKNTDIQRSCLFVVLIFSNHSHPIPRVWIPEQARTICREYGMVSIRREGQDVEKIISDDEILNGNRSNIKVVDELVPNSVSSTRVRECISRGLSIKYLTIDGVIEYIRERQLYMNPIEK
ncbi:hypothetical protein GH714_006713 [Hevea brasiliensis]|uniref:Uncharacterized protein n=1 Tax=Hevea brasiliensis TaxID=3981 RepID=A0A6A6LZT0_HEVBR|nr:hypothetical protein GH714_006713 [Hevea brasiliensis]